MKYDSPFPYFRTDNLIFLLLFTSFFSLFTTIKRKQNKLQLLINASHSWHTSLHKIIPWLCKTEGSTCIVPIFHIEVSDIYKERTIAEYIYKTKIDIPKVQKYTYICIWKNANLFSRHTYIRNHTTLLQIQSYFDKWNIARSIFVNTQRRQWMYKNGGKFYFILRVLRYDCALNWKKEEDQFDYQDWLKRFTSPSKSRVEKI